MSKKMLKRTIRSLKRGIARVIARVQQLQDKRFTNKVIHNQELLEIVCKKLESEVKAELKPKIEAELRPIIRQEVKEEYIQELSQNPTSEVFEIAAEKLRRNDTSMPQIVNIALQDPKFKESVLVKAANIELQRQEQKKALSELNDNLEKDEAYKAVLNFIKQSSCIDQLFDIDCGGCSLKDYKKTYCDVNGSGYYISVYSKDASVFKDKIPNSSCDHLLIIRSAEDIYTNVLELYTTKFGVEQIRQALTNRMIQIEVNRRNTLAKILQEKLQGR